MLLSVSPVKSRRLMRGMRGQRTQAQQPLHSRSPRQPHHVFLKGQLEHHSRSAMSPSCQPQDTNRLCCGGMSRFTHQLKQKAGAAWWSGKRWTRTFLGHVIASQAGRLSSSIAKITVIATRFLARPLALIGCTWIHIYIDTFPTLP